MTELKQAKTVIMVVKTVKRLSFYEAVLKVSLTWEILESSQKNYKQEKNITTTNN